MKIKLHDKTEKMTSVSSVELLLVNYCRNINTDLYSIVYKSLILLTKLQEITVTFDKHVAWKLYVKATYPQLLVNNQ